MNRKNVLKVIAALSVVGALIGVAVADFERQKFIE